MFLLRALETTPTPQKNAIMSISGRSCPRFCSDDSLTNLAAFENVWLSTDIKQIVGPRANVRVRGWYGPLRSISGTIRRKMQQPALRAVREPLIDRQVRGQHNSHQVRAMEQLLRVERAMEIAS